MMGGQAEKFLVKDKYLGPLIKKYGSCKIRPSNKGDYFSDLVETIISQQLSGKAAAAIFSRVKNGLGTITPEGILQTPDIKFRKWGLSKQKVEYIKDLARKINGSEIKIGKLDKLSDDEVIKKLVAVKGIGRWTAEMFLMFSLARPDVFPVGDLGIQKGIQRLLKRKLSAPKIAKIAERWKPYRTTASWYLWKVID